MTPQLFLAFGDVKEKPDESRNDFFALHESGEHFGVKINLDYVLQNGFSDLSNLMRELKHYCHPLFVDLKMWNGSRTMESVVKTLVSLGVDFVNVWALADKQMAKAVKATEGSNTKVLGLTVLSHYDDAYCQKWFKRNLIEATADFSRYAVEAGCHGIILPGTTLGVVKDLQTTKMATGLRPTWYKDDRHEQEVTPVEVARGGAEYAVCGSPILKQPSKEEKITALRKILEEMRQAV